MKYKFFSIPARNPEVSEAALNDFCSQHRISFIEKHLVADGADSFWTICIAWLDGEAAPSSSSDYRGKPKVDYKQILSETDFGLYLELRNHRKELADLKNVPAYALFTNEQLASMVQQRVYTKAALMQIPGVGKSRVDNYGESFLQILNSLFNQGISGDESNNEANTDHT